MAQKNKKAKRTSSRTGTIAAVIAGGLSLVGLVAFGRRRRGLGATEGGSSAADLALDQPHHGPGDRANMDFRPDPTAPVPDDRRDAMAPATLPNPNSVEPAM